MVGYCFANLGRHLPLGDYPGLAAYLDRLKERPAAQLYFEAIAESVVHSVAVDIINVLNKEGTIIL